MNKKCPEIQTVDILPCGAQWLSWSSTRLGIEGLLVPDALE